jgi:hypothetical protein
VKKKLQEVIEREEREGRLMNREETSEERRHWQQFQERMDIDDNDIIIQGSNTTRLSRKPVKSDSLNYTISIDTVICNGKTVVVAFIMLEFTTKCKGTALIL